MKRVSKVVVSACASSFLLSACANPQMVKSLTSEDYKMSCDQISQEIGAAEFAQKNAREDDRFRFSYMLIVPAFVSMYRMSEAEAAAQERAKGLEDIAVRKGCQGGQGGMMTPQGMGGDPRGMNPNQPMNPGGNPNPMMNPGGNPNPMMGNAPVNMMPPSGSPYPPAARAPSGFPPAPAPVNAAPAPGGYPNYPMPSAPSPYPPR